MRSRRVAFRTDLVIGCRSGSRRWALVDPAADPGHGGGQRREPGCGLRCLHRHRQPGRDDATGPFPDGNRHHGPLRRLPVQCQKLQQRRQRRRQRRLFQPGPDVELRAQRKPGFEAGAGGGFLFRVGAQLLQRMGRQILCPEREHHDAGGQPDHRLQDRRLAVRRRRRQRGSRQAERAGGGQHAARTRRRAAQVRRLRRGLRLQPRGALHAEPPDPRGGHLRLAGRIWTSRTRCASRTWTARSWGRR